MNHNEMVGWQGSDFFGYLIYLISICCKGEHQRLRLGMKAETTENTEVGVRLASGSGFQNTTNQSFDEHARGKNIFIDRAYGSRKATDFLSIQGGKHKNPLFTSPLVWDPDVNPEGLS